VGSGGVGARAGTREVRNGPGIPASSGLPDCRVERIGGRLGWQRGPREAWE